MTAITLVPPVVKEKNTVAEPKVGTAIKAVEEFLNSNKLDGATNIKAEGVTETSLTSAVQTKLNQKSSGLELKKQAGSTTAVAGNFYLMETNATTLTLPAPATANAQVGIGTINGVESSKLKIGVGAKIYGDFTNGGENLTIFENQHLIVEGDGTNWRILSGEPTNTNLYAAETTITLVEAEAGVTISKVRPALVTVFAEMTANQGLEITVSGKRAAVATQSASGTITTPMMFRVAASQVWKAKAITAYTAGVKYTSLIL